MPKKKAIFRYVCQLYFFWLYTSTCYDEFIFPVLFLSGTEVSMSTAEDMGVLLQDMSTFLRKVHHTPKYSIDFVCVFHDL